MITGKTIVVSSLAVTPAAVLAVSPAFDWTAIIAALIGAIPPTLGVLLLYVQGRKIAKGVDGVVSQLVKAETGKAAAEATIEAHDKERVAAAETAALAVVEKDKDRAAEKKP